MDNLPIEIFNLNHSEPWPSTEADIVAIAKSYDPAIHKAPISIDHNDTGPSFGWVTRLEAKGAKLFAYFDQVAESLKESVRSGALKYRSARIYQPGKAEFGGQPYLKNVTFLGAMSPKCKGQSEIPAFSEDAGTVEILFSEMPIKPAGDAPENSKKGVSHMADETQVVTLAEHQRLIAEQVTALAEKDAEIVTLAEKVTGLEAKITEFAEREAAMQKTQRDAALAARIKSLQDAGKVIPATLKAARAYLMSAKDDTEQAALFAEAEKDWPKLVTFGQVGGQPMPKPETKPGMTPDEAAASLAMDEAATNLRG